MKTEDFFMLEDRYFRGIANSLLDLDKRVCDLQSTVDEVIYKRDHPKWEEDNRELVRILRALFKKLGYKYPSFDDMIYDDVLIRPLVQNNEQEDQ